MIDELAFVAELLRGSEPMADKILRDALENRALKWIYKYMHIDATGLRAAIEARLVGVREILWRQGDPESTTNVDYPNHRVVRIGPPWLFHYGPPLSRRIPGTDCDVEVPNPLYDEGPVLLLGEPKVTIIVDLVKVDHVDAVRICRRLDLLPPLASGDAPASGPRHQYDRACRALRAIFKDGKSPRGATLKEIWGAIDTHLAAENKQLGKRPPSEDIVAAAVKDLGRSDD
jgi:hypothetical protein